MQVSFGESHKVVGGHPSLGDWDVSNAPQMQWNDGNVWTLEVQLPEGSDIEFKCVKIADSNAEWEDGNNHHLKVPAGKAMVGFEWGKQDLLVNGDGEGPSQQQRANGNGQHPQQQQAPQTQSGDGGRLPTEQWQGQEVAFMRSNEHSKDRRGSWHPEGLEGAALHLVQGDEKNGSWLGKIQTVKELLVDKAERSRPGLDALACAYIYLQWISTGAIPCVEGGGHFRPNRHAELAKIIFRSLEWVIGDESASKEAALVARRMHTKLPSFTEAFTASVPLTRIRDIAHRNDIPQDLKQEIKHTLQNKLHRNAGPEDLVATEAVLQRITAPGADYSGAFVQEFKVFTAELRDFFNASSFADMLAALRESLDESANQAVDKFLHAKGKLDGNGAPPLNDIMEALHSLTTVRANLAVGLSSGLRNDAPDGSMAMRQRWRLAEIRAEDYAFVLFSSFLNQLDHKGGAEGLAGQADSAWDLPLGAIVLGVRHMGLSGWQGPECMALENELTAWQQAGDFKSHDTALRLKATLERVQRLAHSYTDQLLAVYPDRVQALGKGLAMDQERLKVFTEAEVRASLVFQLSKLCSLTLKAARLATGGAEWDALVAGTATGKLIEVQRIEAGAVQSEDGEDVVLLVHEASGDEEVSATGVPLKGVILAHSLPHLSHLGVRARQEKVVFVTCEDKDTMNATVKPLVGQRIQVKASLEGVTFAPAPDTTPASPPSLKGATQESSPAAQPGNIDKVGKASMVALGKATTASCGAKASACAQLAKLAPKTKKKGGFGTAEGVCLPFGCMEAVIQESGQGEKFQAVLDNIEEASLEGGALDKACNKLQGLVSGLQAPRQLCKDIGKALGSDATVIVRSSANVEDLAGMSGAGLYDSIPNVALTDSGAFEAALASVWASLYSRRAVLSRRAAEVKQADAAMAVLVQKQLTPDLSFVLHTVSPLDGDKDTMYAELAVGLGETLASGTRGSPWRLAVNKSSGKVQVLAFANFGTALRSSAGSAKSSGSAVLDYSKQDLSVSSEAREKVAQQLCKVAVELEEAFGAPQDIEGAIVGSDVFIVQTRPQPM
ncbi:2,3-dihydroxyphenylpropionate/2,3-dihydroxicinnamic acid 1,2-dioxygenase, variant 2 [Trebouxia sp. C0009 RCD-2024]